MHMQVAREPERALETEPPTGFGGVDRLTLAIGLGVVVLVAIGIGVAAILNRVETPPDLNTPQGVTLAYALAMQRGEADVAWDLLSGPAQAGTTRQEFLARAATLGRSQSHLSVENVRIDGNTAHLDLVRTMPSPGFLGLGSGSYTNRAPITLVQEDRGWRISVPPEPYVIMRPFGGG